MSSINHQIDIDEILTCIRNAIIQAHTEEDVRVRVSNCIEEKILRPLGITQVGKYEYILISGARVDALYGHVIIEYKAPGRLSRDSDIQKAKEQVIRYIMSEAGSKELWDRYLGVIISDRIAFVRYDRSGGAWILRGPYEVRREVIIKLIEALRGLKRKSLSVNNIVADFGPDSPIAKKTIKLMYTKLVNTKSMRTLILFEDWMRLFKQATGYDPNKLKELKKLVEEYGLSESNVNYDALIFSVHTYYALIMKLLAAEVAYLYGSGKFYRSYVAELDDAHAKRGVEGVAAVLKELEDGGIFKKLLNIENFLEGDYFSWYLEELDRDLADAIAEIARRLSDYEIATPQLEPEFARDLLKRLYQNLMPRDIRHSLGEYYTPDWLAELMLDEVGLSLEILNRMGEGDPLKPLKLKVLDPACGSGTFLVLYISRLRRYAEEHFLVDALPNYVLENVVGYDLNPLAVLTARTNYLLAIADLLAYVRGTVEIPIYLADSIMIEERYELKGGKDVYVLRTVAGEFRIPKDIARNPDLLRKVLDEVRTCLENMCSSSDFSQRLKLYTLDPAEVEILLDLYNKLLDLERQGKDKVWVSILRNAFAPILKGKFDYVVGNPPWVNWENLPEQYREISKGLWIKYGLTRTISTGGFKRDLAMLFLARSFDRYLREGGKLAFLITFTVFKTQAGAGFRSFLAKNAKIHVIHDLVTLMPFEGATNRTGAIVIEKVCDLDKINDGKCRAIAKAQNANMGGVKHVVWVGRQVDPDTPLGEVRETTKSYELVMVPLTPNDPASPWMQVTPNIANAVRKVIGGSRYYEAHAGVYTSLNQVYYVKVLGRTPDGMLVITNPPESGQKKEVKQVEAKVEPDLVYPLIRGEDVKKWYVEFKDRYVIVPHNPRTGQPYRLNEMITRFFNAFSYLNEYKDELKKRSIKPFLSLRDKIKKAKSQANKERTEEELNKNFYILDNIGAYTFTPYKVVWKRIAGAITGKAVSFACAVVEPVDGKPVIPDDGTILVEAKTPDEAYYIAGVLNSIVARSIIASYTYELRQETHIVDVVRIPKFSPNNDLHRRIAELSKRAHELARCVYASNKPNYCADINAEDELRRVEDELDLAVARLYGIPEGELKEFRRLMAILSGEEVPVEDEVEVPKEPVVNILNTLLKPNVESYIEVDVTNPSGEEVEFTYEFPWGRGSFRVTEGKFRINTPPLKPGKYRGVVRWVWRGKEHSREAEVEVSEPVGPRRPRTLLDI
ncbi:MAG: N-6 DNA methylase [Pyrobaculum sp.]|jgi:type II restriction/modification system DNA methylase subunit YeeA|nr:N-6 DNA methylase [Pyrobaculum sp.]